MYNCLGTIFGTDAGLDLFSEKGQSCNILSSMEKGQEGVGGGLCKKGRDKGSVYPV